VLLRRVRRIGLRSGFRKGECELARKERAAREGVRRRREEEMLEMRMLRTRRLRGRMESGGRRGMLGCGDGETGRCDMDVAAAADWRWTVREERFRG
jgi:hypothetical protein